MTALLAIVSAMLIGGSDYAGGVATRRDTALPVTALIQLCSGATVVLLLWTVPIDHVTRTDLIAGVVAGMSGVFSFIAFYGALARGSMSLIAPITAVLSALIPSVVGLIRGERLGLVGTIGIVIALVAVALVSRESRSSSESATPRNALLLALLAGLGFSVFFLALAETDEAAGLVPLVVARLVSVPLVCLLALRFTQRVLAKPEARKFAVFAGVGEMLANIVLLFALQRGPLAVASVFGSLYPISTALLAYRFLGERLNRTQLAGAVLAMIALPLVVL
ncbi:MAG: DMT family transporter [Acidimicrobiales bacterium]